MYCTNCGNQIPDDSLFCTKCGTATQKPETSGDAHESQVTSQLSTRPSMLLRERGKLITRLHILKCIFIPLLIIEGIIATNVFEESGFADGLFVLFILGLIAYIPNHFADKAQTKIESIDAQLDESPLAGASPNIKKDLFCIIATVTEYIMSFFVLMALLSSLGGMNILQKTVPSTNRVSDSEASSVASASSAPEKPAEQPQSGNSAGKLGNFEISIDSFSTDFSGHGIVGLTFYNGGDVSTSFSSNIDVAVFQDGIGLDQSFFYTLPEGMPDYVTKEIQPGKSVPIYLAFQLPDPNKAVVVEVNERYSFSGGQLVMDFTPAT